MGSSKQLGRPHSRFSKPVRLNIKPNKDLSPQESQVESQVSQRLMADPQGAINAYRQANTKDGTTVYNVTQAKELMPEYNGSKELRIANGNAVHEPASALAEAAYEQQVGEPDPIGKAGDVVIIAGGRAAGKTTTLGEDLGPLKDASIVWDTHFRDAEDTNNKINLAHKNGRNVQAIWVHRDPIDAYNGMVERAQRSGRILPVGNFVDTHLAGPVNFLRLAAEYKNDPRINFGVIDNSRGPGNAVPGTLDTIAHYAKND